MLVKDYIPLILVDTENLLRDEWLEWRRKGIGGSDAATIIGVSPFSTARDLYYDKLNIVSAVDEENNWVQKEIGHLFIDETTLLQTAAEMLNEELPSTDMLVKSSEIDVII